MSNRQQPVRTEQAAQVEQLPLELLAEIEDLVKKYQYNLTSFNAMPSKMKGKPAPVQITLRKAIKKVSK